MNLFRNNKSALTKKCLSFFMLAVFGVMLFTFAAASAGAVADPTEMENNDGMYYSDFENFDEVEEAASDLNVKIAEEGFVLMKNNGILPFAGVKNITVLGKNSTDLAYGGGGSGAGDASAAIDVYQSLEAAGFNYNQRVRSFYEDNSLSGDGKSAPGMFGGDTTIGETPIADYTEEVLQSFKLYNDAAVIIITRSGTEGADNVRGGVDGSGNPRITDNVDTTKHYLELNTNELDLLELAKVNFDKVVVVINNSAPLELGVLEDDNEIDSVIWVGHTGTSGALALGRILNGSVNPSGRTTDIYPRDFTLDPTYVNFADNSQVGASSQILSSDGTPFPSIIGGFWGTGGTDVVMYEEGIYMGYRYYETRAEVEGGTWYDDNVVYPFGYGLSYTDFTWEVLDSTSNASDLTENGFIEVDVKVTNIGDYEGKDVVQMYYTAPYIDGEIEKSHVVLGDFAKTDTIKPGQFDVVTLKIYVQDMASYDWNDANSNSFTGYELDGGTYGIKLMKNSNEVVNTINYTVPAAGYTYTTSRITGNTIENRFGEDSDTNSLPEADGVTMTHMSRSDFAGTFPEAPTTADLTVGVDNILLEELQHVFSLEDIEATEAWYRDASDATGLTQADEDLDEATRVLTYQLFELSGLDKDDSKWTTLLNELKWSEIKALIGAGGYRTAELDVIGKNRDANIDGPAGLDGGFFWASEVVIASTWNLELAEQFGIIVGNEALFLEVEGWYAPGMNIHRNQFAGRNFEYYSEDGFLSGKFASAVTVGAQSKGLYVFLKHFALNDQEYSRMGVLTYANEQVIRENYLKAFQIPVEEGNAHGIMSSFNNIGNRLAAHSYALLTEILRNEWGFKGIVVTDYFVGSGDNPGAYQNVNRQIMVGNDIPLGTATNGIAGTWDSTLGTVVYNVVTTEDDPSTPDVDETVLTPTPSYSFWLAARQAAHNVLYVAANSSSVDNGVSFDGFGGEIENLQQFVSVDSSLVPTDLQGTAPYLFALASDSVLPAGLSMNSNGVISGSPSNPGSYSFTVEVSAFDWLDGSFTYTMDVASAFQFSGDAFDSAMLDEAFSATIATDVFVANPNYDDSEHADYHVGYTNIRFSERNDSLPEGLTISEAGVISGTPTEAGDYEVTLRVTYTYWNSGGYRPGNADANQNFVINMTVGDDTVVEEPLTVDDLKAMIEDLVILTEEEVNTLIDAKVLTETQVNTLIDAKVLTEANVNALIDAKALTEAQILTLIEDNTLTETQIQALIDADMLTEADVQDLIDASDVVDEVEDTGCGSQSNASASIIIFTFIGLIGVFFLRRKF